jgi:hypothetical protein
MTGDVRTSRKPPVRSGRGTLTAPFGRRSSRRRPPCGRPLARCAPRSLRSLRCLHRPPSRSGPAPFSPPRQATSLPSRFARSLLTAHFARRSLRGPRSARPSHRSLAHPSRSVDSRSSLRSDTLASARHMEGPAGDTCQYGPRTVETDVTIRTLDPSSDRDRGPRGTGRTSGDERSGHTGNRPTDTNPRQGVSV